MTENTKNTEMIKWNNINTIDKYTFPRYEANVIFYVRKYNTVHIGKFHDNKFEAYSSRAGLDKKSFYVNNYKTYNVEDVDCFINIKDIKPLFKNASDAYLSESRSDVYSNLVIIKYHIGDMDDFYTIVNTDAVAIKDEDNQEYLCLPKLPEYCMKDSIKSGKYILEFVNDEGGFYTYNIYKKQLFGLISKSIICIENSCRAIAFSEAFEKFNELVASSK